MYGWLHHNQDIHNSIRGSIHHNQDIHNSIRGSIHHNQDIHNSIRGSIHHTQDRHNSINRTLRHMTDRTTWTEMERALPVKHEMKLWSERTTAMKHEIIFRIHMTLPAKIDHSPDKQNNNGETCIIEKLIDPRFMSWNLNYKLWLYWELGY